MLLSHQVTMTMGNDMVECPLALCRLSNSYIKGECQEERCKKGCCLKGDHINIAQFVFTGNIPSVLSERYYILAWS